MPPQPTSANIQKFFTFLPKRNEKNLDGCEHDMAKLIHGVYSFNAQYCLGLWIWGEFDVDVRFAKAGNNVK